MARKGSYRRYHTHTASVSRTVSTSASCSKGRKFPERFLLGANLRLDASSPPRRLLHWPAKTPSHGLQPPKIKSGTFCTEAFLTLPSQGTCSTRIAYCGEFFNLKEKKKKGGSRLKGGWSQRLSHAVGICTASIRLARLCSPLAASSR